METGQTSNKENILKERISLYAIHTSVSIVSGAIGATLALFLIILIGYIFIDFSFLKDSSCTETAEFTYCFFDKAWDSGTYLSAVTSFYNTIITVLMGLLAVVAAFAFLTIRASAFQRGEETIEKEVERYFGTDRAEDKVRKTLEPAVSTAVVTELDTSVNVALDNVIRRLEEIEVALAEAELLPEGFLTDGDAQETQ